MFVFMFCRLDKWSKEFYAKQSILGVFDHLGEKDKKLIVTFRY